MISFFPDLNVWIALSDPEHRHHREAWHWLGTLPDGVRLIFSRYTQLGMLRLLSNTSVMGEGVLTVRQAWRTYDRWLDDPRVEFHPEPRSLDTAFREATAPLGARPASKWIGDCYLLAYAKVSDASLVTFDGALLDYSRKHGYPTVIPT
jgi:toxin-antitoxin system PIN domain toxin